MWLTRCYPCSVLFPVLLGSLILPAPCPAEESEVRVTVVAILASKRDKPMVDPRLESIARKVQEREKELNSFRMKRTTCLPVAVGKTEKFPLVDDQVAEVTVKHRGPKDGKVCLIVKAPLMGAIVYKTTCDRFFPIVTRYQTKDKERLIIAVMVPPCE